MKDELMKKEQLSPEQLIDGMYGMLVENQDVTGEEILGFLRKNKSGKLKDIPTRVILPMIDKMKEMKTLMDENIAASFALGMFLNDEPFIPEYIGFEEQVIEVEGFKLRTYRKDNMVVMRNYFEKMEEGKDKWVVTKNVGSDKESVSVHTFDNMLDAVTTLKTLGSGVSILDAVTSKHISTEE